MDLDLSVEFGFRFLSLERLLGDDFAGTTLAYTVLYLIDTSKATLQNSFEVN